MSNGNKPKGFDLAERTQKFGELVIKFIRSLQRSRVTEVLAEQLVRSATSIGANYMEADGAESRKDFQHKIGICKKEAKETMHWLRMIAVADTERAVDCRKLWQEAHELALIFSKIIVTTRSRE